MSPSSGALQGFHHLTAVSADARSNHDFYTRLLGMRLVKKTVNQDDVSAYHLFYADGLAAPGSDLTFFIWPTGPERRGTGTVVETGLRVADDATLQWWHDRLIREGVQSEAIKLVDGRSGFRFSDREGQRFRLTVDEGKGLAHPWSGSPVPSDHQIRGFGPVTISVAEMAPTERVLTSLLGMDRRQNYVHDGLEHHVFAFGGSDAPAELIVKHEPHASRSQPGAGGAHHVAFCISDEDYNVWDDRLRAHRVPYSGPVDRFYFRSLYFREPGGTLFELATVGPGFTADEPLAELGQRLALPPFLEGRREEIEAGLVPL